MDAALREQLSDYVSWDKPDGGYFFWLKLIKDVDVTALLERANALGVGFHSGALFSNSGGMQNYIRLSFAYYEQESISTGITRLKSAFDF
jgi:2-aminoadipate transaminase